METMLLDLDKTFEEIHQSEDAFRRELLEISQFRQGRESSSRWASQLRFLTPLLLESHHDSHPITSDITPLRRNPEDPVSDENDCNCYAWPSFLYHEKTTRLRVTQPGSCLDCVHYVAVSYCWQQRLDRTYHTPEGTEGYLIETKEGMRPPKAPAEIIRRAMLFAGSNNIPFIWIDKECVDQDDPYDKEDGIQAMDLVYQHSIRPLGLLACYFSTQAEMDILMALVEGLDIEIDDMKTLLEVLDIIANDLWFTRAWILQEGVAAGPEMTLMMRHDPSLVKPDTLGEIQGEVQISIFAFHAGISWAETCVMVAAGHHLDNGLLESLRTSLAKLWGFQPALVPGAEDLEDDPNFRHTCNAAKALEFLEPRKNTRIADRLAILANLCDFPVRINTVEVEQRAYSFSTCAFALAVFNGDLSLIDCYGTNTSMPVAFSWCPPRTSRLSRLSYDDQYECRLQEPEVLHCGLWIMGWLWHIDRLINVTDIQTKYLP